VNITGKIIAAVAITAIIVGLVTFFLTRAAYSDDQEQQLRNEKMQLENRVNEMAREIEQLDRQAQINLPEGIDGWQTYSNQQFGFSIRYPENWTVTTETNEGLAVIANFDYPSNQGRELRSGETKRVIRVIENVSNRSLSDLQREVVPSGQIVDINSLKTVDASAIKVTLRGNQGEFERFIIPGRNNAYIITVLGSDENSDKMIETFDFSQK